MKVLLATDDTEVIKFVEDVCDSLWIASDVANDVLIHEIEEHDIFLVDAAIVNEPNIAYGMGYAYGHDPDMVYILNTNSLELTGYPALMEEITDAEGLRELLED